MTKEYIQKATPGKGQIIYDEGYNKHKHEKEIKIAEWIHKTLGGNIKLLNEATEVNVKTPDYKWNEKLWDLKTTTTAKSANSAVRHGLKQIKDNQGGIILDYTDNEELY